MRHILDISYKGTRFNGWQIQPNGRTVQGLINEALSKVLQDKIEIVGSGRTDTGVHAHQQIAHFDTNKTLPESIRQALNSILPEDIFIKKINPTHENFHARFDAKYRSYKYYITSERSPFYVNQLYVFRPKIDLKIMNDACEILMQYTDFESLSKVKTEVNNFNCEIMDAKWTQKEGQIIFYIRANRFLRGMVRTIVGTMLDIGTQRIDLEKFKEIIESKDRKMAGQSVSADGLYLHEVVY